MASYPDIAAAERLKKARIHAKFETASDAARALGMGVTTYVNYENGTRGFKRHAHRLAKFFKVSIDWLLEERGSMIQKKEDTKSVIYLEKNGHEVDFKREETPQPDHLDISINKEMIGIPVKNDDRLPKFYNDSIHTFEFTPANPEDVIGEFVGIRDEDGQMRSGILRRGTLAGTYRLVSLNTDEKDNLHITKAHRYIGTMARPKGH